MTYNHVAYARSCIHSDSAQTARLEIGCDDGVKARLNQKVIISANRSGNVIARFFIFYPASFTDA